METDKDAGKKRGDQTFRGVEDVSICEFKWFWPADQLFFETQTVELPVTFVRDGR